MKRGEVYWATLTPRSGSEQTGRRPVVIVSHDAFNQTEKWRSVIVVPVSTSAAQARRGPTVVSVAAGIAGLPSQSIVICHQVTTLDRAKLDGRLGVLPSGILAQVEDALLAAVGIHR